MNAHIAWPDLIRTFGRIGLLSFGGPAAQISLMHKTLVDERQWLSEQQYLNALGFCMLLPGPEAMQLCTYAGWRVRGIMGGLIAGALFILPGAAVIFALAALYAAYGDVPVVQTLFLGVKAAVLIIVIEALIKVSKRALLQTAHWVIAALSFIAIFFLNLPFPLIICAAAVYGLLTAQGNASQSTGERPTLSRTLATIAIGGALWVLPFAILPAGFLTDIGLFFSQLAVVTFGGAYAVLAYMAQAVVTDFGWLSPEEMIDGLGLAETTPGPLILVTQFVGYIAGHSTGGTGLAIAAACLTLWVTFVPCFIWIFAGAPYIERVSNNPRLSGALSAITAAVVGVILNLSLWFALHVLFGTVTQNTFGPLHLWWPDVQTLNPIVLILTGLAAYMLLLRHIGLGWVLLACAMGSLILHQIL